jgi:hypothetical protein
MGWKMEGKIHGYTYYLDKWMGTGMGVDFG